MTQTTDQTSEDRDVSLEHLITSLVSFLDAAQCPKDADTALDDVRVHELEATLPAVVTDQVLRAKARAMARFSTFCWPYNPLPVKVHVAMYFVFIWTLDDVLEENHEQTDLLVHDLVSGHNVQNPYMNIWCQVIGLMTQSFGPIAQMTLLRGALSYYQSCYTEAGDVKGVFGASYYPLAFRCMGSTGQACGACRFSSAVFDEKDVFTESASFAMQIEPIVAHVNDLLSFYKEVVSLNARNPRDDKNTMTNTSYADGISVRESFDKMVAAAIKSVQETRAALGNVCNTQVRKVVSQFIEGYVRWHICEGRYRFREVYGIAALRSSKDGDRLRAYCDSAWKLGGADEEDEMIRRADEVLGRSHGLVLLNNSEMELRLPALR